MRLALAVVLLLVSGGLARGDDPMEAARLDLTGARVLASPGLPEAMRPFLPEGHAPEPLRWPLPEGPLLLLGLPESDEAAAEIGETLGVIAPEEDLAGGYVVSAWHDGKRPIAVILAEDAAALYGARFEIEPVLPSMSVDRTREVTSDAGTACSCLSKGRRVVRPAWRERSLWVRGAKTSADAVLRAVGARANRIWLDVDTTETQASKALAERARRLGIEAIPTVLTGEDAEELAKRAIAAARSLGARAVVLRPSGVYERDWTRFLAATVSRLTEAGVPRAIFVATGILTARRVGTLDPRVVPGLEMAWELTEWDPGTGLSAAAAREITDRAGVPVHFVETWSETTRWAPPSMPRDRDPGLGEILQGIVVADGPMAEPVLSRSFDPTSPTPAPPDPVDVLRPYVPTHATGPGDLLLRTGTALAAAAPSLVERAPWAAALASELQSRARRLEPPVTLVPLVSALPVVDGRLDDRAWVYAARRALGRVDVLVVGDGRDLYLGVRVSQPAPHNTILRLWLGYPREFASLRLAGEAWAHPRSISARATEEGGVRTLEARLDHGALRGDAYPGRLLAVYLHSMSGGASEKGSDTYWGLVIGR